jgi:hypothetical protein
MQQLTPLLDDFLEMLISFICLHAQALPQISVEKEARRQVGYCSSSSYESKW